MVGRERAKKCTLVNEVEWPIEFVGKEVRKLNRAGQMPQHGACSLDRRLRKVDRMRPPTEFLKRSNFIARPATWKKHSASFGRCGEIVA